MRHQTQKQLKAKRLLIAEAVIKNLIQKDKLKEAAEIGRANNISDERFNELTNLAYNKRVL